MQLYTLKNFVEKGVLHVIIKGLLKFFTCRYKLASRWIPVIYELVTAIHMRGQHPSAEYCAIRFRVRGCQKSETEAIMTRLMIDIRCIHMLKTEIFKKISVASRSEVSSPNFNSSVRAERSFAIRYPKVLIKPLCDNLDIWLNS